MAEYGLGRGKKVPIDVRLIVLLGLRRLVKNTVLKKICKNILVLLKHFHLTVLKNKLFVISKYSRVRSHLFISIFSSYQRVCSIYLYTYRMCVCVYKFFCCFKLWKYCCQRVGHAEMLLAFCSEILNCLDQSKYLQKGRYSTDYQNTVELRRTCLQTKTLHRKTVQENVDDDILT